MIEKKFWSTVYFWRADIWRRLVLVKGYAEVDDHDLIR
jgi:hypothetical protein